MPESSTIKNDFISKVTSIIESQLSNEQFGVSELAEEVGMSRSNLLRKVQKLTGLSVSQFIRKIRLQHAMEMLKDSEVTVSEVTYQTGFSSTSYFIKCFREEYGYPPGEVGKTNEPSIDSVTYEDQPSSHQLAAIMFTDIQGYTSLMQQDEDKAIKVRERHREVFEEVTAKFKGKILQYYGDGTLSTFNSAIDAVHCGIELQLEFLKDPRIPIRIGIHSGDILFTKDGIIGDGVNIASRVESLASAGSVFVSEKIHDEIKNQPDIHALSMGTFELKNVEKPLEVFAITNQGLEIPDPNLVSGKLKEKPKEIDKTSHRRKWTSRIVWAAVLVVLVSALYITFNSSLFDRFDSITTDQPSTLSKKSIAVLPFINDSNDSANVYIINGLMESILNNLQKIEDLRVISRTSVEKYRNNPKSISEIATELNAKYLIEGSGQKIGDQILLNIQLIDAETDSHLWSEQYDREVKDIFKIQQEVAKVIASQIEVIITPEEEEQIDKVLTENLEAYDHYLRGQDQLGKETREGLEEAIGYFQKAIAEDPQFASAYAYMAISYYYMDLFVEDKQFMDQINHFADQALLFDAQLPQSLIAKALFYMSNAEYEMAVSYLEKALEYGPNSAWIVNFLSDIYTSYIPNTEKYLEYALKGISLDIASQDSSTASFTFLHVSNAFIQTGFVDQAKFYIDKSMMYNPENLYSQYVNAYILYGKNQDIQQTKDILIETFQKDTTRLDVMQEVGKICYYMRDFETSYSYYRRFVDIKKALNFNIFQGEDIKIGYVFAKMGKDEEASELFDNYETYIQSINSMYKEIGLAAYYAHTGDTEKAIEYMNSFAQHNNYQYWILLFLEIEPLLDNIKDHPDFKKSMKKIETTFWREHKQIKASLKKKGLI